MNGNEFNQDGQEYTGDQDAGSDDASMPIGIGGMDGGDAIDGADAFGDIDGEEKRKLNSGALLLVGVVVIAIVGLFSMRTLTRASAAGDGPTEVEQSIESFLTLLQDSKSGEPTPRDFQLGADEAAVLDILNESYASRQVALAHVQRNPFIIFEESGKPDAPSSSRGPDPMVRKRQDRQSLFEQAAGRLEVRSVLMGTTPLATINNTIVQVGGTIVAEPENVTFRVLSISTDSVKVIAEDTELKVKHETTLSIDRDRTNRGVPQRSRQRGPVRPR